MLLDNMKSKLNEVNPAATQIATFLKDMEDSMATESGISQNIYDENDDDDDFDVGAYNSNVSPADYEDDIDLHKSISMSTEPNDVNDGDCLPFDSDDGESPEDDDDDGDDENEDVGDILSEIEEMNSVDDNDDPEDDD